MRLNLLVADDHPLFRKGLIAVLKSLGISGVLYEAEDGVEVLEVCRKQSIDVVFLDINMPRLDGLEVARELLSMNKATNPKIIVISLYKEPILIFELLRIGVHGYISKSSDGDVILDALHHVTRNSIYYPSDYDAKIKELISLKSRAVGSISMKEKEFIKLIAKGLTNKEIATQSKISLRTVETQRNRLEKKLGVSNTAALIDYAYRVGILAI
ncbi:response regulator [Ohtaekwangia kribbensis]|jgi:two-component system response regulator NreC|uniref:Response regulator n=1 Tax=Ohtaekwangia kribbensis TaxID=688913 RepID=A0ABW3K6Q5_9BACT